MPSASYPGSSTLIKVTIIHRKKAMRGLRAPSQSKPIMMKKPYGSSLVKEYWKLLDEKPMRIFDPSSGGMGIRLKAASIMLIWAK